MSVSSHSTVRPETVRVRPRWQQLSPAASPESWYDHVMAYDAVRGSLCPQDCDPDPVCGDFFCDPGETRISCPGDCRA